MLPQAVKNLRGLIKSLQEIAQTSGQFAEGMEFGFLVDPNRQILSIGYDMELNKTHEAC